MRSFTHNELAQYNGQEGRPAYIGVRGNVYDVSEVPECHLSTSSQKVFTSFKTADYRKIS